MENKYKSNARVFKALSDPNRLRIIEMLQCGERCACELLEGMNIAQSTLSHHMKILCDSGLTNGRPRGKWMYYSLSREVCEAAKNVLNEITSESVHALEEGAVLCKFLLEN
jgi:ArsR family transcriptional regulator